MSGTGSPTDRSENAEANADTNGQASPNVQGDANASASGDDNLSSAAPSSGDGDKGANKDAKKPTLAEVMKTAVAQTDAASGKSPDPAKDGKDKPEDGAADAQAKDGKDGEPDDSKLPFHNHPRWKEVIGQKNALADQVKDLTPAAEQFSKIETFMNEHRLSHEEVGEGFIIMAMIKNGDPRGLQKLDEYRDRLAEAIGEKIPKDIQDQIDSGAITEDAGKELSRTRAREAKSTAEAERLREANTQRDETEAAARLAEDCKSATNAWAAGVKKTDPDFAKKEPAIARYARALMLERGQPKTKDEAVQIVKDAYDEVNKDFAAALPNKEPSHRVPVAPSNNGAKPAPKNLRDAVAGALGG